MDRNAAGFFPLAGHGRADLGNEPLLEFGSGFNSAAADDEGIGVEGADHLIEEQGEGMGLGGEELAGERVALFGEAADEAGGFTEIGQFGEFVVWIIRQIGRQQRLFKSGEGADGFEIANAAAVT